MTISPAAEKHQRQPRDRADLAQEFPAQRGVRAAGGGAADGM